MRQFILVIAMAAAVSLQPAWLVANDQQTAQQIAASLQKSGKLKGYDLRVKFKSGTAWLSGRVANSRQSKVAADHVRNLPQVKKVVNHLKIGSSSTGQTSSRKQNGRHQGVAPAAHQQSIGTPVAMEHGGPAPHMPHGEPIYDPPVDGGVVYQNGGPGGAHPGYGGPRPAYVPGAGMPLSPARYDQPYMPSHAWPSYAAYPNYAGVTYPKTYSPTAWPFIGPFYPYPQVPLGWRKVTLEWDDGWWMLDFKQR